MTPKNFGFLILILVWFAFSNQLSTAKASDTFVFTAIPDEDESRLRQRFNKVAIYLQEKLDVPIKYIPLSRMLLPLLRLGMTKSNWHGLEGCQAFVREH